MIDGKIIDMVSNRAERLVIDSLAKSLKQLLNACDEEGWCSDESEDGLFDEQRNAKSLLRKYELYINEIPSNEIDVKTLIKELYDTLKTLLNACDEEGWYNDDNEDGLFDEQRNSKESLRIADFYFDIKKMID